MIEGKLNPDSTSSKAEPDIFHSDRYQKMMDSKEAFLIVFLVSNLFASFCAFMIAGSYWAGLVVFSAIISVCAFNRSFFIYMKMFHLENRKE